ncbi:hypothetical protein TRFO_41692 [Tritrichomonas foetus]|uniref:Phosphoprotein phosphatase n=1 Tax=Tritrichomonas foetus TaxID=1144522 RepID=A0A1J4KZD5_9EUKA|nr:hypothetical protein TRFO_41692 [Tritrichomonas foetus]|eukprot:OHT16611.1 hypothetical protein TRFO_41692 [Tritrichomonas foetus]
MKKLTFLIQKLNESLCFISTFMTNFFAKYIKRPLPPNNNDPSTRRHSPIAAMMSNIKPTNPITRSGASSKLVTLPNTIGQNPLRNNSKSSSAPSVSQLNLSLLLEVVNSISDNEAKVQYLNVIISQILDYSKNCKPMNESVDLVFELFQTNIFREIPDLDASILYADTKISLSVPNWEQLKLIYQIFILTLKNTPVNNLQKHFTKKFVDNLINLLKTPEPQEVAVIEIIISFIFDHMNSLKTYIFEVFLKNLDRYLFDDCSYNGINSILKFYLALFKNSSPFNSNYIDIYKNYILPLFKKPYLTEYQTSLNNIVVFMETKDPRIGICTIEYILKYWPETDSNKETALLNSMPMILQFIPPSFTKNFAVKLFNTIVNGIKSPNYKVCQAALILCTNSTFLSQFTSSSATIVSIVAMPLKDISKHWNCEAREIAMEAIRTMYTFNNSKMAQMMIGINEEPDNDIAACHKWARIVKMAIKNDDSIIINDVKQKLESFLNTVRV